MMYDVINEIEKAAFKRIKEAGANAGLDVAAFDLGKSIADSLAKQAQVGVTTERVTIEYVVSYYELRPVVSVYVAFKGVQLADRHQGVYPLALAVAVALTGWGPDIPGHDIEPFEPSGPMIEVFPPGAAEQRMRVYKIDFKTAFEMQLDDDNVLEKLLTTVNEYQYRDRELGQVIDLSGGADADKDTDDDSKG